MSPFDVESRRAAFGVTTPSRPAPVVEPPVFDLEGVSYYVDDQKSVADPALKAENEAALAKVRSYVATVVELTDTWLQSQPPNPTYATQALDALHTWAAADALLGRTNRQGEYEREWTLGSLALAYLEIQHADALEPSRAELVEQWLRRIAIAIVPYYERPTLASNSNNHAYWAGMAVAAAAIASQDLALFNWGMARARIGIAQVQPNGLLPLESRRGALALHYHVFALTPLVMLAEMGEANDVRLYDESDSAIARLANLVISAFENPSDFEALVPAPQSVRLPPRGSDLCWAEPYFARIRDSRLTAWLRDARPLRCVRLGGNVTTSLGAVSLY